MILPSLEDARLAIKLADEELLHQENIAYLEARHKLKKAILKFYARGQFEMLWCEHIPPLLMEDIIAEGITVTEEREGVILHLPELTE